MGQGLLMPRKGNALSRSWLAMRETLIVNRREPRALWRMRLDRLKERVERESLEARQLYLQVLGDPDRIAAEARAARQIYAEAMNADRTA